MKDDRFDYHKYLNVVVEADIKYVKEKDVSYGASWKKRGGVGSFMMLARKWDRLEEMSRNRDWDVIEAALIDTSGKDGTALAEIRDLRRYLLLLEAEILYQEEKNGKTAS